MPEEQRVFIVDDDEPMRESMKLLLEMLGYRVRGFASAKSFLATCSDDDRGCLVLDLRMPEMNGLELQQALRKRGYGLPIIFLSGFGDVPTTVRAVKEGAVDFLEKPVSKKTLIERIERAFEIERGRRRDTSAVDNESPREPLSEVCRGGTINCDEMEVCDGRSEVQAAAAPGWSGARR